MPNPLNPLLTARLRSWSPALRVAAVGAVAALALPPLVASGGSPVSLAASEATPTASAVPSTAPHAARTPSTPARAGANAAPSPAASRAALPRKPATATRKPAAPAATRRPAVASPQGRWLPTGAGMWLHMWSRTARGDARKVVQIARANGVSTLYVRTGSSHDGFTPEALSELLPMVRGAKVDIVAWDFPELKDPVHDAIRLARAARYHRTSASRVMAVAPDIETAAEGTRLSEARVRLYMQTLRRWLPGDVAILGTVPWPSQYRVGSYPYRTVAQHSDALMPMAYWYDNDPRRVTLRSIDYLKQFRRPVLPVGQGYDSRIDVPSLPRSNPRSELSAFMHAAKDRNVHHVSLWSWQTAGSVQWGSLRWASRNIGRR